MNQSVFHDIANTIRALTLDAVDKAHSGHCGAPLGMAEIAAVLWQKHLNVNPQHPNWDNRDRFVLSNGHASMLLYALLHLSGFDLSLEDLKNFRTWHSKTAGHPEVDHNLGIETTTGPLGQGIANAVGLALAEARLAVQYNREHFNIVDHYTYCFLGDGCLMEGIAHEACSLAGTLGLGKLIIFYDANGISIDGNIDAWFAEDVAQRFAAYGWQVIGAIDGHDPQAIDAAITAAQRETTRPSIIICHTTIGFGSPKFAGSEQAHGSPFDQNEIEATKKALSLPLEPFSVAEAVYRHADLRAKGAALEKSWQEKLTHYAQTYPELFKQYQRCMRHELPETFSKTIHQQLQFWQNADEKIASRKASENALTVLTPLLPELIGGSADLSSSNNTICAESRAIYPRQFNGNYIHYGVREFAMAAMMNGLYLHGGLRPYGGTFLVFSDYMRNAIRLSALMRLPVIYVLTHDSIGLGEDGPTHQPIEQLASLRLMPNLHVWRPCDAVETLAAWQSALTAEETPSVLALSRQALVPQKRTPEQIAAIARGGYVLHENASAVLTLIATGSEVELAMNAARQLAAEQIIARVVSMPCVEIFQKQSDDYRESVLPNHLPKLAIEAGATALWQGMVAPTGAVIGIDCFGASAPASVLFTQFGLTTEAVVQRAKSLLII